MNKKILEINYFSLIIIITLVFLALRIIFLAPVFSDENIYINMAKGLTEGLIPYKDFFYAHPPIQLYLFVPIIKIFGNNFAIVKIYMFFIYVTCLYLTYLISSKIFDKKSAVISFLFFLLFPGSLIFGNQAMGMFEAMLFFLTGFYFLIYKKPVYSSIFFMISIFTRYLSILLIPFVFLYILKFEKKILIDFSKSFLILLCLSFLGLYTIFGEVFFVDTFLYHLSANIKFELILANWMEQYFVLGFFTIFLSIFCITFSKFKKNRKLLFFSFYPLFYDLIVLILFKQVIYHYFVLALPLLFIAVGKTFTESKDIILRSFLVFILLMSIFTNLQSLDLYFNKKNNGVLDEIVRYTIENTEQNDLLFGEPRSLNYVSFITDRKIINNYFDSDFKFINFVGKEDILNKIDNKPELVFGTQNYIDLFKENYKIERQWNKPGYYNLFLLKRSSDIKVF
jgi:hypothetical protein